MAKIKVLPDIVANKIAAGEVVERPASVVKELAENSVDAGATKITIDVENGGRRLIRIADNGSGMGRDDALLSIERHATSKITCIEDIAAIMTLGFRGEALPSVVSVSRAVIDTRRKEDELGTRLVIDGGVIKDVTDIGLDPGTIVEVRNLFYNLPARRRFLKSEATELNHIKSVVYDMVVSSPALSVTLIADGREVFSFRGSDNSSELLRQIFGKTNADRMIPFDCGAESITVSGFIGPPDLARRTSQHQFLVMNGRPIVSRGIARAVRDGFGRTLIGGMFPVFLLRVEIDPALVDVNVHPTKREVKIHREFALLSVIREQIALTVQSMDGAPELGKERLERPWNRDDQTPVTMYSPPNERWYQDRLKPPITEETLSAGQISLSLKAADTSSGFGQSAGGIQSSEKPAFWQLKDRYIITSIKEGAMIIDQHVAHERILFEEILGHFAGKTASAQQLLFPVVKDYSAADYDILEPMLPFLNQVGFGVREFGECSVMIDAVPSWFRGVAEGDFLNEYIDEMRTHGKISSRYIEKIAAAVACRSAVKSGEPLSEAEMQDLIDRLFATKEPFVCPHGRPIVVKLTLDELDRRFGRK